MEEAIREKRVPHCIDESCNGLVKPEIVFFGEQLPSAFFDNRDLPEEADLVIVMGSSLSVHPFASLPQMCRERTPRILINKEQVGDLGHRADDVLMLEDCDSGVRKLADACGWLDELEVLWASTAPGEEPPPPKVSEEKKSRDEKLQDEVDKITQEIEQNLKMGQAQHAWLEDHLKEKAAGSEEQENSTAEPTHDERSRIMAPVAKSPGDGSLGHVFPFAKKGSL